MIDTHCHLSHPDFEPDREAVIDRTLAVYDEVRGCGGDSSQNRLDRETVIR